MILVPLLRHAYSAILPTMINLSLTLMVPIIWTHLIHSIFYSSIYITLISFFNPCSFSFSLSASRCFLIFLPLIETYSSFNALINF